MNMLESKHEELVSQFDDIKGSVTLISIFVGVVILTGVAILMLRSRPLRWIGFGESDIGTGIGVTVLVIVVLVGVFAPLIVVSGWMDRYWNTHYRRAWSWLKHTDLPRLMVDHGRWAMIREVITGSWLLKPVGIPVPRNIHEQVELASDFHAAMMVMARGTTDGEIEHFRRKLTRAVINGCFTRYLDNAVVWLFNGCASMGCLIMGGIFWYGLGLPVWLPMLCAYIRRQAWQTAMYDYLANKSSLTNAKIGPPKELKLS